MNEKGWNVSEMQNLLALKSLLALPTILPQN
jgi:hypothetical protein